MCAQDGCAVGGLPPTPTPGKERGPKHLERPGASAPPDRQVKASAPPQGEAGMASRPLYTWKPVLFLEHDVCQDHSQPDPLPSTSPSAQLPPSPPAVTPPSRVPEPLFLSGKEGVTKGARKCFQGIIMPPKLITATPTLRRTAPDPCTPGLRAPRASGSLACAPRRMGRSSLRVASPPPGCASEIGQHSEDSPSAAEHSGSPLKLPLGPGAHEAVFS